MKEKLLAFLNDHIEDAEVIFQQASGGNQQHVRGAIDAFETIKEFVDTYEDEEDVA